MGDQLTPDDFRNLVRHFEHAAWRLETLPVYTLEEELPEVERYRAGNPTPPPELSWYREWLDQIAKATNEGKRIERVRISTEPPTLYQQWESWAGQWNVRAGEQIRYISRSRALEIGLPVDGGDWWLFDSLRLAKMRFDPDGRPCGGEIITDPAEVIQACAWRDLAVHYSAPTDGVAAA